MSVSAGSINAGVQTCLDRTACLVPRVRTFTASVAYGWDKPALCLFVEFILVGGGGGGGNCYPNASGGGGGGGGAGEVRKVILPAALVPSELSITIGAGGASYTDGGVTSVSGGTAGFQIVADRGLAGASYVDTSPFLTGGAGGLKRDMDYETHLSGGQGGSSGGSGGYGRPGYGCRAAAGGTVGNMGEPGLGYGAGGCGQGHNGSSGGGGGGGGYGTTLVATVPDPPNDGGHGASGYVMIISWCGTEIT